MNVLIVEDEAPAAEHIIELMKKTGESFHVQGILESIEETVQFFSSGQKAELLFLDTELADGKCFEIFNQVKVEAPIIFTSTDDQYAIHAFKHFSIDYLLKPIQTQELSRALNKFQRISKVPTMGTNEIHMLNQLLQRSSKSYRERFLIKAGNKLQFKQANETAYFFADGKATYLVTKKENRKHLIDHTLEELESTLDPNQFFRISRKFIIHVESIGELKGLISSKLEIKLNQPCEHELSVSRDRASAFKNWLDR